MKTILSPDLLPTQALLLTCSSHEARCEGFVSRMAGWKPTGAVIFHYDDVNPKREIHHKAMVDFLDAASISAVTLQFSESNAVMSLRDNMNKLKEILASRKNDAIVLDISVFTKRHLLMILRWLDDEGYWDKLCVIYTAPEDYDVSQFIPLSFGIASFQQIPGFSACPDLSRPVHLVLFLGYEGDRVLATYEHVQPMQTTLVIPYPPYQPSWAGRTERFNADLLGLVGKEAISKVDSIDPEETCKALEHILGDKKQRSLHAKVVGPLGTKPQTLGIYSYVRECNDPPAIVYASPLRHNHEFFSHGIGKTWLLKSA
jgi:hypothetical protein